MSAQAQKQPAKQPHDWWPVVRLRAHPTRKPWQCKNCFAVCQTVYLSHARGWQKPKAWQSHCKGAK